MTTRQKFSDGFLKNSGPARGISDITSVPFEEEESPSPEMMIDALYLFLVERLDKIDAQIESILEHVKK